MTDPALTVRTARLRLRTYRPSDAEALLPIYAREDVSRFLLCDPWTAEVARTEIGKRIPRTGLGGEAKALALVIETDEDGAQALLRELEGRGIRVASLAAGWSGDSAVRHGIVIAHSNVEATVLRSVLGLIQTLSGEHREPTASRIEP